MLSEEEKFEQARLSALPFRKRWPHLYSMKGLILSPVKPPGKGRHEITFETALPAEVVSLLTVLMCFPIKDLGETALIEDLKVVTDRAMARLAAKKETSGDKKKDTTPSKGKNNARKSRSITPAPKADGEV